MDATQAEADSRQALAEARKIAELLGREPTIVFNQIFALGSDMVETKGGLEGGNFASLFMVYDDYCRNLLDDPKKFFLQRRNAVTYK